MAYGSVDPALGSLDGFLVWDTKQMNAQGEKLPTSAQRKAYWDCIGRTQKASNGHWDRIGKAAAMDCFYAAAAMGAPTGPAPAPPAPAPTAPAPAPSVLGGIPRWALVGGAVLGAFVVARAVLR